MHTFSPTKVKSLFGVGAVVALALSLSSPAGAHHTFAPRCYELEGTACSGGQEPVACTDACGSHLRCTCTYNYSSPWGYDPYIWDCDWEC